MKKIDDTVKICFLRAGEVSHEIRKEKEFCALDKELFLQKPIGNTELILELRN
jgi:hypothetical protein